MIILFYLLTNYLLTNSQFYTTPLEPKITSEFSQWIASKMPETKVKIWVFYTDKGILDEVKYKDALREKEQSLSPKVRKNRLTVRQPGKLCDFTDIPVYKPYVEELKTVRVRLSGNSNWLNASAIVVPVKLIPEIAKKQYVQRIEPVRVLSASVETSIKGIDYGGSKRQLEQIDLTKVHAEGYTGDDVILGILDSGFEWRRNKLLEGINVIAEYDFIGNDDTVSHQEDQVDTIWCGDTVLICSEQGTADASGGQLRHGSAMLCLLGGRSSGKYVGAAFNASFALAKTEFVLTYTSAGKADIIGEEDCWIRGAEWLADTIGVDIISNSLGYKNWWAQSDSSYKYSLMDGKHYQMDICASKLWEKGVLLVTAMGNDSVSPYLRPDTCIVSPASADSVLAVGGVDTLGNWVSKDNITNTFSIIGPRADGARKPEICGPWLGSYGLPSPFPTYDSTSEWTGHGTSCATAIVAGACACIKEGHPDWGPMKIREAIMKTASIANSSNDTLGYGIVDAYSALYCDSIGPKPKPSYGHNEILSFSTAPFMPARDGKLVINYQIVNTTFPHIYIYTLSGKLVRDTSLEKKSIGRYSVEWDGKTNDGKMVSSGIYICLLSSTTAGDKDVKKFAVIR